MTVVVEQRAAAARLPVVADPRPVIDDGDPPMLIGGACAACGHAVALRVPRCPRCRGDVDVARYGPLGTVYAATKVCVPTAGRPEPYVLAYLDLDDGPRLLVHLDSESTLTGLVGVRARLIGVTESGDPCAEATV